MPKSVYSQISQIPSKFPNKNLLGQLNIEISRYLKHLGNFLKFIPYSRHMIEVAKHSLSRIALWQPLNVEINICPGTYSQRRWLFAREIYCPRLHTPSAFQLRAVFCPRFHASPSTGRGIDDKESARLKNPAATGSLIKPNPLSRLDSVPRLDQALRSCNLIVIRLFLASKPSTFSSVD